MNVKNDKPKQQETAKFKIRAIRKKPCECESINSYVLVSGHTVCQEKACLV